MTLCVIILLSGLAWGQLTMRVASRPPGATVTLDGISIGETPVRDASIETGTHTMKLEKEGYAPLEYDFEVYPAKSVTLDFQLNRLYPVTVSTEETGLRFQLNEEYTWTGKKEKFLMEAGEHSLNIFRGDSLLETRVFTIDQPTNINYQIE